MFCPKCGQELVPKARFCAHCGADIQSLLQQSGKTPSTSQENVAEIHEAQDNPPKPDIPVQKIQETQPPKAEPEVRETLSTKAEPLLNTSDDDSLDAVVGKNQAYYLLEFQKIRTGEKSRFNWAAFLFGPAFCLYRKCEDLFKRYFLIPIPLILIGYLVQTIGTVQFNLMLITGGGLITAAGGILGFINLIRLGLRFNQLYYKRCSGTVSPNKFGTSIKAAAVFYTVIILTVALIGGAGAVAIRQQYASIFDDDILDISDRSKPAQAPEDESEIFDQSEVMFPAPIAGQFDNLIGVWQDEYGNYVNVYYTDETMQWANVDVATAAGDFIAELILTDDGGASGVVMGYGTETKYAINLNRYLEYLEATIYYGEYDFSDTIRLVPGGHGDEIDGPEQSGEDKYSDYNLYFYEGYYTEASESIEITLSVVPNGTSFACELFWNYGKLLELGTVRPGVPTLLSEGTTITIDLETSGNIYVLLEGDGLLDGSYSFYMMRFG